MAQARPRHLSAALALLLFAREAEAGGPANRVDTAVRFAILGRLVEGATPQRRAEAGSALDRAVEAALRSDWAGAVGASDEARALLLGRSPAAAERIAWGLRLAALPPVEAPARAAWRRVELRFLPPPEPPLPDFVEVRLRVEPFDAAPVPVLRTSCRARDLVGRGDVFEVEIPEVGPRATLFASVRLGGVEADAPGFPLALLPEAPARLRRLRERPDASPEDDRKRDLQATLSAEVMAIDTALGGELPGEDFDLLGSLERAEALAGALGAGSDPLLGERGEIRRATFAGGMATSPSRFRLWVPTAEPPPGGYPVLLLVPSAFETEASPFRAWAGGSLRDLAEAKGVLVGSISPEAVPGDPVESALASIRRTHPVDPERIHLLGRGSGAAVVQRYALAHAGELASLAILDGGLADEKVLRPLAPIPVVAGGSGRGPTAPASRAIADAASRIGSAVWRPELLEGTGWFESSTPFLREAIARAASVRRPR
ncbi:MAG TPA: hypothetical protein VFI25_05535 [Planctomycetota bacterium]|jgi:hypothetical protein|nr:hypothetical protein [Planctomycetota bacterium]